MRLRGAGPGHARGDRGHRARHLVRIDRHSPPPRAAQVHGDVFRAPQNLVLFCALVGTGSQLATMVFLMILFATATTLYMGRGAIIVSFIVCYSLTSLVAGYSSGALYCRSQGGTWIKTMMLTAGLFPGVCLALTLVLNSVAVMYKSLAAVPLTSVLMVLLIWVFLSVPLCVLGTILGRNWSGAPDSPCRVNAIPRLIPDKRWYARPPVLICLGGVLPFGSIFIEMYFVFTSFWNYKFYYVYGFMCTPPPPPPFDACAPARTACSRAGGPLRRPPMAPRRRAHCLPARRPAVLVYVILAIVTVCVTIVVTYFLLNNEDYRWVCLAVWGGPPSCTLAAPRWAVAEARCVGSALLTATVARPLRRWPWTAFAASCSTAGYVFLYSVRHTAGNALRPRPVPCSAPASVACRSTTFSSRRRCPASSRQSSTSDTVRRPRSRACAAAPAPRCRGATHARAAATAVSIFCVALGVMCGTLGYCGCSVFVRRIYVNIKSD